MLYVILGVLFLGFLMFVFLGGESSLEREVARKMKLGVELQRSGKLREYGELMKEVEEMEKK